MSQYVKEISGKQLNDLIAEGKTVVCDFWASWCGPCRMLAPVLDEIAGEMQGSAQFVKVNIDENEEVAIAYGISSIPNVIVFAEGKVKANSLGFVPKATLKDFLQKNV